MAAHYLPFVVGPLLAFSLYRRFRRNFGKQRVRPAWMIFRIVMLAAVALLLLTTGLVKPVLGLGALAGLAAGAGLAVWGLRLATFRAEGGVFFYTPNPVMGMALSAVLLGRLAYRFLQVGSLMSFGGDPAASFSPLTLTLAAALIGYYLTFNIGVLRRARATNAASAANDAVFLP